MRIPFSFIKTATGGGSVPVVSAVSYDVVDTAGGGQRVVVTVNSSTGCTAIAAGGVAFTSFAIDDGTHVSGIPGAHAAGVVDVVVTNATGPSTTGTGLIEYWSPATPATPAQWTKANYTGSPWTATNGVNLTEATNAPATGSAVGGFTPANFDGTNDKLAGSAVPYSNLNGSITFASLVYIDTMASGVVNPYEDSCLLADSDGAFGVSFGDIASVKTLRAFAYNGAGYDTVDVTTAAFLTGAWVLVFVRYDGSANTFEGGANANTLASGSANGAYTYAAQTMKVGTDYAGTGKFFDGKMLEHIVWNSAISDANRTKLRKYVNQRYGVTT